MILKRTLQLQRTHEERQKGNKSSRFKMVKRIKERRNRKAEIKKQKKEEMQKIVVNNVINKDKEIKNTLKIAAERKDKTGMR